MLQDLCDGSTVKDLASELDIFKKVDAPCLILSALKFPVINEAPEAKFYSQATLRTGCGWTDCPVLKVSQVTKLKKLTCRNK